jgi:ArsR family transcriptional regulator, arsenate/arsenite/antimonite-responsive transcriptional repressor
MVTSKTNLFEKELQQRALVFKALAHPARLQILQYLVQTRICLSGDISEMFPISRTTVNQHMNELKNAGLVCGHEKDGKIYYCLNIKKIGEVHDILSGFLDEILLPADFCCHTKL